MTGPAKAAGATRAEYCVVACAEAWRGDGEILASPMGTVPTIGARLAKLTFSPDLLLTDGEAMLIGDVPAVGSASELIEGWLPYRAHLAMVTGGKRHVMMGAGQVDRFGNQNISCIGGWEQPTRQLLGSRGAPVNTLNNPTSYWVPRHSSRVFVARVDMVSGVGYDRAAAGREDRDPVPRDPPGHLRPRRLRLRHPGPVDADPLAAPGRERGTGAGRHRLPARDLRRRPAHPRADRR
ncbi:acyl CoA:acetate/3-ketoacid CoA transferase beta subunit [Streptomyces sp. SPB162]|nr:acyl CoA:acetate/3-ketoacid CoA transferase beta subunit [Streptomyces sp. SPB162]